MTTKIKVRRPRNFYVLHGLWMLLTLYKTIDSASGRYIWALLFLLSVLILVSAIRKGSYLEKDDSRLIINGYFFQTTTIEIADIQKIELRPGLFSQSRIVLKDNGIIKFNYHEVNDTDFNELMKSINVPVS